MRATYSPREVIYIGPPPVNRLGKTGLWTSVLGLFTCGVLSPLGLLVSFLALSKKPRGAAAAGLFLGLIGSVWIAFWGALVVGGAISAAELEKARLAAQTRDAMVQAEGVIQHYQNENERLPEGIEGNKLVLVFQDSWGTSLRYDLYDNGFVIRSAGSDAEFDTSDDLLQPPTPPVEALGAGNSF